MVPAENLSKQHGGGFYGYNRGRSFKESLGLMRSVHGYELGSDIVANSMAEDESRTNSTLNQEGSSSKENNQEQEPDKGWLQLSIGGQTQATTTYDEYDHKHGQDDPAPRRGGSSLMELDLLPVGVSQLQQQARPLAPIFHTPEFRVPPRPTVMHSFSTLFVQQHQQGSSSMIPHHGEINWAFKPIAPTSSSSLASYFGRPFQLQPMDVAGPSSEFRIIDPPRRPHSGIWFTLQASHNQTKEPFLPQIPKSYIRIKDGKMAVRLIMKYLANKLRLDSESEIEIRCRGQQLGPLLTMQHVRDQIWSSSSRQALPDYTSTPPPDSNNNVMVLHYGRS
ncbi:hypothetical protein HRI_004642600 [Hibiscus trionum]|nr:hypothetical protein HRI_004642600 [Hibiscus trionum]